MNAWSTPFGQLRPLQGGNLARVANPKEVDYKLSSRQVCIEPLHECPRGECIPARSSLTNRVHIWRPSSLCPRGLKQSMELAAKGAHIVMQAKADVGHLEDVANRYPDVPYVPYVCGGTWECQEPEQHRKLSSNQTNLRLK